jgi:hypothetical protein
MVRRLPLVIVALFPIVVTVNEGPAFTTEKLSWRSIA